VDVPAAGQQIAPSDLGPRDVRQDGVQLVPGENEQQRRLDEVPTPQPHGTSFMSTALTELVKSILSSFLCKDGRCTLRRGEATTPSPPVQTQPEVFGHQDSRTDVRDDVQPGSLENKGRTAGAETTEPDSFGRKSPAGDELRRPEPTDVDVEDSLLFEKSKPVEKEKPLVEEKPDEVTSDEQSKRKPTFGEGGIFGGRRRGRTSLYYVLNVDGRHNISRIVDPSVPWNVDCNRNAGRNQQDHGFLIGIWYAVHVKSSTFGITRAFFFFLIIFIPSDGLTLIVETQKCFFFFL
jgi:hypothetical protein